MQHKTHHTAIAIVPPEELWEPIQAIRQRHDRQIHRWMPHINLLYPFLPRSRFAETVPDIVFACAAQAPFLMTLAEFRFFRHGSGRCTLWLAPDPPELVRSLQAALQGVFPDCDELGRFPAGFIPHLSVGQFPSLRECERTAGQLQATWEPITFTLGEVCLLARDEASPFMVARRIALAG